MKITPDELGSILVQFNPWWRLEHIPDLPTWHRGIFTEFRNENILITNP